MAYDNVVYGVKDGMATLTLNRPDAYNALNLARGRDLLHAALEADEDRGGALHRDHRRGAKHFAPEVTSRISPTLDRIGMLIKELTTDLHGAVSRLRARPSPFMGVNGVAAGGGMSFALSGDLVVAAESASSPWPIRIAASPDGTSSYFLPRLRATPRAGAALHQPGARRARGDGVGLVNRVHPDAEFSGALAALARELAGGPTLAFGRAKELFRSPRRKASRRRWSSRRRPSRPPATPRISAPG